MDKPDLFLAERSLGGDAEAFAALVRRYAKPLYAFAYRYAHSADEAEDIVQESFIKAWRNLKKFNPDKKFSTWLFAITKNTALDALKKRRAVAFSEIGEGEELDAVLARFVGQGDANEDARRQGMAAEAAGLLSGIPPAYRRVVSLRHFDRMKFREIAEELDEPLDTVKSRYRRGINLLRKICGDAP